MKRGVLAGIAVGAVLAGAGLVVTNPTTSSLPDVQVPAVQLSNAEGMDATVAWLDLFAQSSGSTTGLGGGLLDSGAVSIPNEAPLVVIDEQNPAADFERILDGVIGKAGSQYSAVTSGTGPDAVTYLILNNGY
ncbi:MAG TPA: hypothetical protein VFR17_01195 [Mycobacterium sp.]|nr:hypothetical protein [Mycobacterium sp.]